MKTKITTLLGIESPVVQGGMAWVAESHLAAAVSNAGGLGIIGAASAPAEWVRAQIQEVKRRTDKPFGVNIMLISPYAKEVAELVAEEKVPVVTTGAGSPEKYMSLWKEAGIKVIPVVASVALAKRMERCGADALVAEGAEAGGHIGENTTMVLVPQVVDAVNVPVIAAGGIADGRGMAAVLGLDAEKIEAAIAGIEGVSIANYNCPGQIVITGWKESVEQARAVLKDAGAKRVLPLNVSGPFHSPMLQEAAGQLKEVLDQIECSPLQIPYVTNVTGRYVSDIEETKELLIQQIAAPVRWQQSVEEMIRQGVDTFVEIGPGRTLSGFLRKINRDVKVYQVSTWEDIEKAGKELC